MVKDSHIIATGYNGTPSGMSNCTDGGCVRCKNREKIWQQVPAMTCVFVFMQSKNTILQAARFGISVEGAVAYTTMRPCF